MIVNGLAPTARRMPISLVRSRTMISMMLVTPIAPAARVPMPTIQIRVRMPPKRPWIFPYSSSRLKCPKARVSSGATLWRSLSRARTFSSATEAGTPSFAVTANQPTRSP